MQTPAQIVLKNLSLQAQRIAMVMSYGLMPARDSLLKVTITTHHYLRESLKADCLQARHTTSSSRSGRQTPRSLLIRSMSIVLTQRTVQQTLSTPPPFLPAGLRYPTTSSRCLSPWMQMLMKLQCSTQYPTVKHL